jgi:hypothetical protein
MGVDMIEKVIGELTGGDKALVSALEGFEDLKVMGKLQLEENEIRRGDVVVAISEGGMTQSVIGTVLEALELYRDSEKKIDFLEARNHIFYFYNNPDSVLQKFERIRPVLDN